MTSKNTKTIQKTTILNDVVDFHSGVFMPEVTYPKTVVLHQQTGIGDLVWHIPYLRAIAKHSANGQIALIAAPTTLAKQLLAPEKCINQIIDYYHLPRTQDRQQAQEGRIARMKQFANQLKTYEFERAIVLSGRASRGLLAYWSGIPSRLGYGYRWTQRIFLNSPPYIERYKGSANPIYHEASAFCVAHGFCEQPIVPKMYIPEDLQAKALARVGHLPKPLYALAIGSSEVYKQWGTNHYSELALTLTERGFGVILIGGKMDTEMALNIRQSLPFSLQNQLEVVTDVPILESAAMIQLANACIGNDTGLSQIAAACDCLCYVILGARQKLDHDPLQRFIESDQLLNITTTQVIEFLQNDRAPGFQN